MYNIHGSEHSARARIYFPQEWNWVGRLIGVCLRPIWVVIARCARSWYGYLVQHMRRSVELLCLFPTSHLLQADQTWAGSGCRCRVKESDMYSVLHNGGYNNPASDVVDSEEKVKRLSNKTRLMEFTPNSTEANRTTPGEQSFFFFYGTT